MVQQESGSDTAVSSEPKFLELVLLQVAGGVLATKGSLVSGFPGSGCKCTTFLVLSLQEHWCWSQFYVSSCCWNPSSTDHTTGEQRRCNASLILCYDICLKKQTLLCAPDFLHSRLSALHYLSSVPLLLCVPCSFCCYPRLPTVLFQTLCHPGGGPVAMVMVTSSSPLRGMHIFPMVRWAPHCFRKKQAQNLVRPKSLWMEKEPWGLRHSLMWLMVLLSCSLPYIRNLMYLYPGIM